MQIAIRLETGFVAAGILSNFRKSDQRNSWRTVEEGDEPPNRVGKGCTRPIVGYRSIFVEHQRGVANQNLFFPTQDYRNDP